MFNSFVLLHIQRFFLIIRSFQCWNPALSYTLYGVLLHTSRISAGHGQMSYITRENTAAFNYKWKSPLLHFTGQKPKYRFTVYGSLFERTIALNHIKALTTHSRFWSNVQRHTTCAETLSRRSTALLNCSVAQRVSRPGKSCCVILSERGGHATTSAAKGSVSYVNW